MKYNLLSPKSKENKKEESNSYFNDEFTSHDGAH